MNRVRAELFKFTHRMLYCNLKQDHKFLKLKSDVASFPGPGNEATSTFVFISDESQILYGAYLDHYKSCIVIAI